MRPDILQNLRDARNKLASLTATQIRLIGDPSDATDNEHRPKVLSKIARNDNMVWFRIARHVDTAAEQKSIALHVERLSALVAECLDAILSGKPRVQVKITFDGYEHDPRELYEIDEVRCWMRSVFIENIPQAIALIDEPTFHVAQTTCNPVRRAVKVVGPLGSPGRVSFEISPEWQIACYMGGIDAIAAAERLASHR